MKWLSWLNLTFLFFNTFKQWRSTIYILLLFTKSYPVQVNFHNIQRNHKILYRETDCSLFRYSSCDSLRHLNYTMRLTRWTHLSVRKFMNREFERIQRLMIAFRSIRRLIDYVSDWLTYWLTDWPTIVTCRRSSNREQVGKEVGVIPRRTKVLVSHLIVWERLVYQGKTRTVERRESARNCIFCCDKQNIETRLIVKISTCEIKVIVSYLPWTVAWRGKNL